MNILFAASLLVLAIFISSGKSDSVKNSLSQFKSVENNSPNQIVEYLNINLIFLAK